MPSAYFHEAVARRALERAGVPAFHEAEWILGAQGPDPLFFYRVLRPRLHRRAFGLSGAIHSRETGDFLCALIRLAGRADEGSKAYCLGFLSHYAADTTLHPFVYGHSFSRRGKYKGLRHLCLEARMDTWAWRQERRRGTPLHHRLFPKEPELSCIAGLFAAAAAEVFPEKALDEKAVHRAFCDARRIARLLYSPRGIKYAVFWLLERLVCLPCLITGMIPPRWLPRRDFLNKTNQSWQSPWEPERPRRESVPQLMEQAVSGSARYMTAARAYWRGEQSLDTVRMLLENLHYGSGLPWQDTRAIKNAFL
jgi:hypothetical protein